MLLPEIILFKRENGPEYHRALKQQFFHRIDGRVRAVYLDLSLYTLASFDKRIVMTCLIRTPEENKAAGGYEFSAHLEEDEFPCRAGDSRTHNFTDGEIEQIIAYLRRTWGDFLYVEYHESGTGPHLHINIRHKYRMAQI